MKYDYEKARAVAAKAHEGQTYGKDEPYTAHLDGVGAVLKEFGFADDLHQVVAQLHDTVEDTDLKVQDIKDQFGLTVAMAIQFLTDAEGRNRVQRKRLTHSRAIRVIRDWEAGANKDEFSRDSLPVAVRVKLADRLFNVRRSIGTPMLKMYHKERETFYLAYHSPFITGLREMWAEYDKLLGVRKP